MLSELRPKEAKLRKGGVLDTILQAYRKKCRSSWGWVESEEGGSGRNNGLCLGISVRATSKLAEKTDFSSMQFGEELRDARCGGNATGQTDRALIPQREWGHSED